MFFVLLQDVERRLLFTPSQARLLHIQLHEPAVRGQLKRVTVILAIIKAGRTLQIVQRCQAYAIGNGAAVRTTLRSALDSAVNSSIQASAVAASGRR